MDKLILTSAVIALLIIIPVTASGEVYIPDHEYVGFYDQDGIFTVIGGVKNNEMYPVTPTITVNVNDDGNISLINTSSLLSCHLKCYRSS